MPRSRLPAPLGARFAAWPCSCRPAAGGLLVAGAQATNPGGALITAPSGAPGDLNGITLDVPYPEPADTFTDMAGHPFTFAKDATRPVVLVFFGYTNCPDVCSTVLADVAAGAAPARPRDPQEGRAGVHHHRPRARHRSRAAGLPRPLRPDVRRADRADGEIQQVATGLGVALTGKESTGAGYTVGHGAQVLGFGPDHMAGVIWLPGTAVKDLRSDVVRLASTA